MLYIVHTIDNNHQRHALLVGRDVFIGGTHEPTDDELNEFLGSVSERECWQWSYVTRVDAGNSRGLDLFLFRRLKP